MHTANAGIDAIECLRTHQHTANGDSITGVPEPRGLGEAGVFVGVIGQPI